MTEADHLQVARRLSRLAENFRREGDDVAMAEMLWGAVNRVANAIALQHELGSGNRLPRLGAVLHHLATNHHIAEDLRSGQVAASALHGHFYSSHLEPDDLTSHVANTQMLIADLIDIYNRHGRS